MKRTSASCFLSHPSHCGRVGSDPHHLESGLGDTEPAPPPSQATVQKTLLSSRYFAQKRMCSALLVPCTTNAQLFSWCPKVVIKWALLTLPVLHATLLGSPPRLERAAPFRASLPVSCCLSRLDVAVLYLLRCYRPFQAQPVLYPSPDSKSLLPSLLIERGILCGCDGLHYGVLLLFNDCIVAQR